MTIRQFSLGMMFLCALGFILTGLSFREPIIPPSVNLPLGEQNRSAFVPATTWEVSRIDNVRISDLPSDAVCTQVFGGQDISSQIMLDCYWHRPETMKDFVFAKVTEPLPTSVDTKYWRLDRQKLKAEPVTSSWLEVNGGKILALTLLFILIGICSWIMVVAIRHEPKPLPAFLP